MACELSSSYSYQTSSIPSVNLYLGGTMYSNLDAPRTWASRNEYQYFGQSVKVLATDEGVYTFAGQPNVFDRPYSNYPPGGGGSTVNAASQVGGLYMYLSNSSGINTHLFASADLTSSHGDHWPARTIPDEYVAVLNNSIDFPGLGEASTINGALGYSVDAISSSNGIYIATSAPMEDAGSGTNAGKVFLFLSNSSGISQVATFTGSAPGSYAGGMGPSNWWNYSQGFAADYGSDQISLALDSSGDLYIAFHDLRLSTTAQNATTVDSGQGGVQLHKSSSSGVEFLAALTASTEYALEYLGFSNRMVVDGNSIYVAAAAGRPNAVSSGSAQRAGRVTLFEYDISAGTYTDTRIEPDLNDTNQLYSTGPDGSREDFYFGHYVDMISGSDGIYIAAGSDQRTHDASGGGTVPFQGEAYVFRKNSDGISQIHHLTGTVYGEAADTYGFFGSHINLQSASSGLIISTVDYDTGSYTYGYHLKIIQTGSSVSETREIGPYATPYITGSYDRYPDTISTAISGNTFYIITGDPDASFHPDLDGFGTDHYINTRIGATQYTEWGLSGSCSEQQQQGGQSMSTDPRGLAVYSGSSTVFKFLDDGSSIFGSSSSGVHSVTGTMQLSGTETYDLKATGDISASAFHGDGSNLTGINATPDISDAAGTIYLVGVSEVGSDQTLFGDDTGNALSYSSTTSTLSVANASVSADLTVNGNTTLGNAAGDKVEFKADVSSSLTPSDDSVFDLGAAGSEWRDLYIDGTAYLDQANIDQLGSALNANSQAITNINVDSGAIDGTVIGANSAAAGTFTTLVAGGDVDLGDAATDSVTVTGRFDSDLLPIADSTSDLGSSTLQWAELHVDQANIDQLGSALDANSQEITNINVDSGAIDGTVIGANSAAAGNFTNLDATGTLTVDGNVTLGDSATDTVEFKADISSSLTPSDDDAFDLGAPGSEWNDLYVDGVAHIDQLATSEDRTAAAYITSLYASQLADPLDANSQAITNINVDSGAIDGTVIGANSAAAGNFTNLDATGTLAVDGNSTLGDSNQDSVTVNGYLKMSSFDGTTDDADNQDMLETFAASPSSYNGAMIYVSAAYNGGDADAKFYFDNGGKWYFCENGTWYPSPFSS